MAKNEQVLVLQPPNELRFKGPFTDVITSELVLNNTERERVCFKVKTTAPKRYCVRPNSGIIEGLSKVTVAVMLQPFDYDPNEKNKHKFMVQTMIAPEGECNLDKLFKEAKQNDLMDSKLRCVFELPGETQVTQNNVDAVAAAPATQQPPQQKASPKINYSEADLKKATEEIKTLRTETSALQKENLRLKELLIQQRRGAEDKDVDKKIPSYPTQDSASMMRPLGVVSFVMFIIGYFIAKFIL